MIGVWRFKQLDRWDSFTIPHLAIPPHLGRATVGSLLTPRVERIDRTKTTFDQLQPITIHFDGRISRRVVKSGTDYSLPLLRVRPGDVVLSKIDLKNGALGVLEDGWDNAVVTTHFKVYEPDRTKVHPTYLKHLLQTPEFKAWLWSNRSGADGRTEVKLDVFEALEVPLPPLPEQVALASALEASADHAAILECEASDTETAALRAFEAALGLASPVPLPDRPMFVARFRDMERWSHEGVLRRVVDGEAPAPSAWPLVRLGDVVAGLENGWSPQCLDRSALPGEWGVLKLGAVSFGRYDDTENKALPWEFTPRPHLEVKVGDVLITRGNVARLVAACVLVEETKPQLMIPDLVFRVKGLDHSQIEPAFLVAVMATHHVRRQIEGRLSGTSPTMKKVSTQGLLTLTFPLPPKAEQDAMTRDLTQARARAAALRDQAEATRAAAWSTFEAAIYAAPEPALAPEAALGSTVPA